jgi:hypothetical protein
MEIRKYEPMLEVKTYDGEKYYIKEANKEEFKKSVSNFKLVDIGETTIATNQIVSIKPPENESDLALIKYPTHIRNAVLEHALQRFKALLRYPKPETLIVWADRLTNGEALVQ